MPYLYILYRKFCVLFYSLDPENKSFLEMGVKLNGRVYQDIADENLEIHLLAKGCDDFSARATDKYLSEKFGLLRCIQKDFSH